MKIRFWGTAAAEGIPCLFCGCKVCKEAREKGGRYIRTRSQLLVEDKLLIDFNADTYSNAMRYQFDTSKLEHILITHTHADHYYPTELSNRGINYSKEMPVELLTVHGTPDLQTASQNITHLITQKRVAFDYLTPYESTEIAGIIVTPLPAAHGTEHPYVYLLEKDGKTFFLYNDSGLLDEQTIAWLKEKKIQFDCVSFDCTFGEADASYGGTYRTQHMGFPQIEEMRKIFVQNGNYKENTVELITHFSHNIATIGYGDMEKLAKDNGFVLAYDGLEIEV